MYMVIVYLWQDKDVNAQLTIYTSFTYMYDIVLYNRFWIITTFNNFVLLYCLCYIIYIRHGVLGRICSSYFLTGKSSLSKRKQNVWQTKIKLLTLVKRSSMVVIMAKTNSILEIFNQFKSKCMVWKLFDQKTAENIRTFI
jgi:hypothetical protein